MTLQNSNSAFKHRSLVLHFRCLGGSLGPHFGSFEGPFWDPKSFILSAWGSLGTQKEPIPKKSSKKVKSYLVAGLDLWIIFGPFFNDFLDDFFVRFLDHF